MSKVIDRNEIASNGEISDLKADIAALRSDFAKLVNNAGEAAKARANSAMEQGRDTVEGAGEQFELQKANVESRVRENPLAAIGIAFGVGALIAAISRR